MISRWPIVTLYSWNTLWGVTKKLSQGFNNSILKTSNFCATLSFFIIKNEYVCTMQVFLVFLYINHALLQLFIYLKMKLG